MNTFLPDITPFLAKTTAIMTAVIILALIGAWLVSTEKEINRATVTKYITDIRKFVLGLLVLEGLTTFIEFIMYCVNLYFEKK